VGTGKGSWRLPELAPPRPSFRQLIQSSGGNKLRHPAGVQSSNSETNQIPIELRCTTGPFDAGLPHLLKQRVTMSTESAFKVAAAHAAPVFMNKAATIKKVVALIDQAANDSIKLLVFPETFIPGYPVRRFPLLRTKLDNSSNRNFINMCDI
jgi:Carbon-nitrogen hydrolase